MGSLPRLKIKDEIRYRKGSTNESVNCVACAHFMPGAIERYTAIAGLGLDGSVRTKLNLDHPERSDRCRIIGMGSGSRYNVRKDFRCDRQTMSDAWRRQLEAMRRGDIV